MLATYFGAVGDNLGRLAALPVAGVHIDLVRAPEQLEACARRCRASAFCRWAWSMAAISGRPALTDAERLIDQASAMHARQRLMIAPSCSLLHVPVDLDTETKLDAELKSWLAFATQKLDEDRSAGQRGQWQARQPLFPAPMHRPWVRARTSPRIHDPAVKQRLAAVTPDMAERKTPFKERIALQQSLLNLPLLPTTTIGSLPQTARVRELRAPLQERRGSTRPPMRSCWRRKPPKRCAGRTRSASTCWCMANSSATTWWNISASSWPASPSPNAAGCRAMARAASSRRSSSATCRARSR